MNSVRLAAANICLALCTSPIFAAEQPAQSQVVVRCAVVGGLMETEFWEALADRFTRQSGHEVEVVARGQKEIILKAFATGEADLIAMHNSDAIINLVADGKGVDPKRGPRTISSSSARRAIQQVFGERRMQRPR